MKKTKGVQREMYEQKKKVDNFRRCALCKITVGKRKRERTERES